MVPSFLEHHRCKNCDKFVINGGFRSFNLKNCSAPSGWLEIYLFGEEEESKKALKKLKEWEVSTSALDKGKDQVCNCNNKQYE